MSNTQFIIRLVVAMLSGLTIGFERQWSHKSAGTRTTTLVSVGAAIFTLLSIMIYTTGDISRVIGQVVTGIGFLCAGVIFKEGMNVHGLTTAVTIWCSASIGCLAAAGFFFETAVATALVLIVNVGLKPIDKFFANRNKHNNHEKN